jgi:hypothetical protein
VPAWLSLVTETLNLPSPPLVAAASTQPDCSPLPAMSRARTFSYTCSASPSFMSPRTSAAVFAVPL